jgi:hypothetical protein
MSYGPGDEEYYEESRDEEEDWEEQQDWAEEEGDPDSPYYLIDGVGFANPGGNSALRAATKNNPRNLPCPTCGRENMLTPLDVARGYQCDICADEAERGW